MALVGADHGDPEARAGAYQIVEFLSGFRGLLKALSAKPTSPTTHPRRARG